MNQLENMGYTASSRLAAHTGIRRAFPVTAVVALGLSMVVTSIPAQAQNWQVDPQLSVARLSLGAKSNAVEIGLARASGEVLFDSQALANPTVKIKIAPGDTTGPDYAEMSFASKTSTITRDGKFIVTGDLSLTRIERPLTVDLSEAFSGPKYGAPVAQTTVRQMTLVFTAPRHGASSSGMMHVSGTISLSRADFPQLLDALTAESWPTQLVNGRNCAAPLTIGEDFSGVQCTGTVIASVSNVVVPAGVGEGFRGFQPAVTPDPDRGVVTLDLTLKQIPSAAPVLSGATTSARPARGRRRGART